MNVWTDFVPAESDKTRIKKYLRKLTLAMHFATDGRSLVTDYHLYWYPNTAPVGLPKWGFSYKEGGGACGDYHDGLGTRIIVRSNYWCKCAQGLPPGCTCTRLSKRPGFSWCEYRPVFEWEMEDDGGDVRG